MAASSPSQARKLSYAEACAHRESGRLDKACGLDTSSVSRRITQRGIGGVNLNQRGKSEIIRKVDREDQSGGRRCCSGWKNEEDRICLAREIKRNLFVSRSPEDPQEIGAAEDLTKLESSWDDLEDALRRIPGANLAGQSKLGEIAEPQVKGACRGHLATI